MGKGWLVGLDSHSRAGVWQRQVALVPYFGLHAAGSPWQRKPGYGLPTRKPRSVLLVCITCAGARTGSSNRVARRAAPFGVLHLGTFFSYFLLHYRLGF